MAGFQGVAEKFYVSLVPEDGYGSERVVCQIGLDGLVLSATDGGHLYHKYPLNHISRWAIRSSNLVLYTKTPSDVEEKTLTLHGTESVVRSMLDTLTSSCMQMAELLQSRESTAENRQASSSLNQLLHGGGSSQRRGFQMPSADDVDYWSSPEKAGWLHSQGDHIKTWRRRWFVLKQGYLFRFGSPDVSITSKPRGIVDLSKVQDVSDARDQTGKNNSLKLSTAQGHVCYIADSETELVEWMSALEGAVQKIVRAVAGVQDEPPPQPRQRQNDWSKELEKGFSAVSGSSGMARNPSRSRESSRPTSAYSEGPDKRDLSSHDSRSYDRLGIHDIAGIAGMAGSRVEREAPRQRPAKQSSNTYDDSFVKVEYPSYPVLAPGTPASQAASQGQPRYEAYSAPNPQQSHEAVYQAQYHQQQQQQPPQQQQHPDPAYGAPAGYGQASGQPGYHSFEPARQDLLQQAQQPQHQQPQPQAYAPPQQAPSMPAADPSWQIHYTGEGRAYYHHAPSGTTQWEPPAGFAC